MSSNRNYYIAIVLVYLSVQRCLRYKRVETKKLSTLKQFQELSLVLFQYEFPFTSQKSLEFGLFKTYGIPSISKLLVKSRQLLDEEFVAKRYEDTDLLIREVNGAVLDSSKESRSEIAIGRINYIHSLYPISNQDMLYTLAVFICEPITWINKYEYRRLTCEEEEGIFQHWKNIGTRMNIKNIPGHNNLILDSLDKMKDFMEEYEAANMIYDENNAKVAQSTVKLFLSIYPKFFHSFITPFIYAMCPERLRTAMGFPKPPWMVYQLVRVIFSARAFITRYLLLPRLFKVDRLPSKSDNGHYIPQFFLFSKIYRQGYKIEELGPDKIPKGCLLHFNQ